MSVCGRLAKILLIVSGFIFILQGGAFASTADTDKVLYSVTVNVDKTDKSAALAREKAIVEAEQFAYKTIFKRITLPEYSSSLPELKIQDLKNLVKDISVKGERTSSVRYIASLTITLKAKLFRDMLEQEEIPYVNTISAPVLLIPVSKQDEQTVLFPDQDLLALWKKEVKQRVVVPLIIPDDKDRDIITKFLASSMPASAVKNSLGVSSIYIAKIIPNSNNISFVITNTDKPNKTYLKFSVSTKVGKTKAYTAALDTIAKNLENNFKIKNMVESSASSSISVVFPINNIMDWQNVQQVLSEIDSIDHYELQAIGGSDVSFTLYFTGSISRLVTDMSTHGLILSNDPDEDIWYLRNQSKDKSISNENTATSN